MAGFEFQGNGFGKKGGGFAAGSGFSVQGQNETPDPRDKVEYTGDMDVDLALELEALQEGFKDRARRERKRYKDAVDSEFWFATYFQTREQKDAFLEAMGLQKTIYGDVYIDGNKWARAKGVELPDVD